MEYPEHVVNFRFGNEKCRKEIDHIAERAHQEPVFKRRLRNRKARPGRCRERFLRFFVFHELDGTDEPD